MTYYIVDRTFEILDVLDPFLFIDICFEVMKSIAAAFVPLSSILVPFNK